MLELLYQALSSPLGIVIVTPDNPELVRQKLYQARRADEDFQTLSIIPAPGNPQEIWLVKNNA